LHVWTDELDVESDDLLFEGEEVLDEEELRVGGRCLLADEGRSMVERQRSLMDDLMS
jgi:hypothetical protein